MATRTEERDKKTALRRRFRTAPLRRRTQHTTHREEMAQIDQILTRMRERRNEIEEIGAETRSLLSQLGVR